jgi:molybdopterin-binding protein
MAEIAVEVARGVEVVSVITANLTDRLELVFLQPCLVSDI